jgi:RNA polymerase sigma-70 factor (ECF subfamily)
VSTSPSLDDEAELIARARADRSAFASLYELYVDKVYTYALYHSGNASLAEDIVSETFLRAFDHLDSFHARGGGFAAWLFRIARNLAMDTFRRNTRLVPLEETLAASPEESPEEKALAEDEHSRLRTLVEILPPAQREVIILKFSVGLSNKDIAAATGRSETAVSSLVYRAMETLRKEASTW